MASEIVNRAIPFLSFAGPQEVTEGDGEVLLVEVMEHHHLGMFAAFHVLRPDPVAALHGNVDGRSEGAAEERVLEAHGNLREKKAAPRLVGKHLRIDGLVQEPEGERVVKRHS